MPYVIFIAAPGMENLKKLYDYGRYNGYASRTLTVSEIKPGSLVLKFV